MSRPALRIARADAPQSVEMSEAIMALAQRIVAQGPSVVMMIWEVPNEDGHGMIYSCSLPDSAAIQQGFISILYDRHFPPEVRE